jgi:hypothetical protein
MSELCRAINIIFALAFLVLVYSFHDYKNSQHFLIRGQYITVVGPMTMNQCKLYADLTTNERCI